MHAAEQIRAAIAGVMSLREAHVLSPALGEAIHAIKGLQARRFAHTYADLAADPVYAPAVSFFLTELYADRDFRERDLQFGRIAGALERWLPPAATETAVALAELHGLSERLDHEMALAWLQQSDTTPAAERYVEAWRRVSAPHERGHQLELVLALGRELIGLTQTPGLLLLLKAMRGPAKMAGLAALQSFLETGFHTFKDLALVRGRAERFLDVIEHREREWLTRLFEWPKTEAIAVLMPAIQATEAPTQN
jgi:hypothetical protein